MVAMIVTENHRLQPAVFSVSPNFDERPRGINLTTVVIHCISLPRGQYGTGVPSQLFTNTIDFDEHPDLVELQDYRVSAHLLVERTGVVNQFVPFDKRAWHAGVSEWQGQNDCNDFSIGIELEGTDDSPFEDLQYENLVDTLVALLRRYRTLSLGNIVGHNEVAQGRKSDPGDSFNWQRVFREMVTQLKYRQRA